MKDGGPSNLSNVATAWAGSPTAPSHLTAVAISRTRIDLAWTDNATNEENFFVTRCTASDECDSGAGIGWAGGPNVTTFSDTSVQPNTTYTYRVYGYRSDVFEPSNKASATTPP